MSELYRLPDGHKDLFDRIIAAQAMAEGLTLVSPDPVFREYPLRVLW